MLSRQQTPRFPGTRRPTCAAEPLTEVVARGKHLLFRFDDGRTLHTHFEMDGR
ncbi:MAG: hypothetical protein U0R65_02270 [Candidatus Nanopelagicales bacterium]